MSTHALRELIDQATNWEEASPKGPAYAACRHCGTGFHGRPNKLYCSKTCKKRAENERAKFQRLIDRQSRHVEAEKEALRSGDYHDVRYIRACRKRDIFEIDALLDKTALKTDPIIKQQVCILINKLEQVRKK